MSDEGPELKFNLASVLRENCARHRGFEGERERKGTRANLLSTANYIPQSIISLFYLLYTCGDSIKKQLSNRAQLSKLTRPHIPSFPLKLEDRFFFTLFLQFLQVSIRFVPKFMNASVLFCNSLVWTKQRLEIVMVLESGRGMGMASQLAILSKNLIISYFGFFIFRAHERRLPLRELVGEPDIVVAAYFRIARERKKE